MTATTGTTKQRNPICSSKGAVKSGYIFLLGIMLLGVLLLSAASAQTCYSNLANMPAICEGGTKTTDTYDGCRKIICTNGGSSTQILACDKPSSNSPAFFEMYRQNVAGSPIKTCIGSSCIQNEGYVKSGNYPICSGAPTCTPSAEVCDSKDNDCDGAVDEGGVCTPPSGNTTCYSTIETLPATCQGGTKTSDTYDGCRTVICTSGGSSTKVKACDKPDWQTPSYFEMYRQSVVGSAVKTCFGNTCIQNEGYVKGTNYPVCIGGSTCTPSAEVCDSKDNDCDSQIDEGGVCPTCTPTTETCNSKDDDCDGAVDEGGVCTPSGNTTCYSSMQNIPAACNGGAIQSDSFNGCRSLVCSNGPSSLSVMACNKPDGPTPQYFEIYKQVKTGTDTLELCLDGACIKDNGYAKSSNYPICITTSGGSGGANAPPLAPTWVEPQANAINVDVVDFHIHANDMQDPEGDAHKASSFEIWDDAANQKVWAIDYTENAFLLTHVHNGDGVFQGNLAGQNKLKYDTQYKVRARYWSNSATNNMGPWSAFQFFKTKAAPTSGGGPVLWSARPGYHVELVSSNINTPVNIVAAPNLYTHLPESQRPLLYVTQLYGSVGMIRKDGSYKVYADNLLNYEVFGSIPGSGETGVDGIYVDPVTGDLFVSMVYANDDFSAFLGKVTRFTTNDNGDGFTAQKDILKGISIAPSHHIHTITRGPDGKLYVTTGDAHQTSTAKDSSTTNGKVLRFNEDGTVPSDNPVAGKYFYAGGFRNPFGQAWRPGGDLYVTNNGPDTNDGIYRVKKGNVFGWCCDTAAGVWHLWPQTTAPVQVVFNSGGNNFPSDTMGSMFVALSGPTYAEGPVDGSKRILQFRLNADGSKQSVSDLAWYSGSGHGTPIGLAFASDGLYFTDIFGEAGFVGAGETKGNIYKVVVGDGPGPTAGNATFSTAIAPRPWYPKGLETIWECKPTGGSGNYRYSFNFGDGTSTGEQNHNTAQHVYAAGTYTASCTVRDITTAKTATASTTATFAPCAPDDFQCNS